MILTIVRGARVLAGLSAALALLAGAWPAPARADDGSGVARISSLNGTVTMQRADSGDTVAAAINAPVSVGDYISTGQDSRTEVQLDAANFVRVGSSSQLRFTNLDPTDSTLQVAQGTIEVRVLDVTGDRPLVQTPSIGIRPAVAGRYRINVTNDGDTLVSVRSGSATLVSPLGSQTIATGTTVMVSGSSSNPQVSTVANIAYDDFDSWNSQRDQFVAAAAGDPYANTGIPGLADLDSYGHWVSYPSYGQVWVASSYPANWAPYQDGRWVWQPYYGWTWVGYEPWGWAPYHYGRWFYAQRIGWAWYPGPVYVRPVYRPALVAFFGFGGGGSGFSFNLSFGNVGWVPLAPYESYHPWWGPGYVNRTTVVYNYTNVTNITNVNITKIYRNAAVPHAVSAVSTTNFTNGGAYHYVPVNDQDLHNAALVRSALPVVPTKQNLSYTNWSSGHVASGAPLSSHFSKLPPPKTLPPTFAQQRSTVQTVAQHVYPGAVTNGTALDKVNTTTHAPSSAWDRFNNPNPANGANASHTNSYSPNTYKGNTTWNASGQPKGTGGSGSGGSGSGGSGGHKTTKTHTNTKPAPVHTPKPSKA